MGARTRESFREKPVCNSIGVVQFCLTHKRQSGPSGRPSPPHVRSNINEKTSVFWEAKIMKKFAFVAALSVCAVSLISLAPAQDMSKKILPTMRFNAKAAVERTPEQMDAFDATFVRPGHVREAAVRPTMDEAQYASMKHAADLAPRMASR